MKINMNEYSKEQMASNLETVLKLEWLGVRIEDVKEQQDPVTFMVKTIYYFSVPESSTIEIEGASFNDKIKTANDLKLFAKEQLTEMVIDTIKNTFPDEEDFIEDVKNNTSEYFKFYAKVREGEIWNEELGNKRIEELSSDLKLMNSYSEV